MKEYKVENNLIFIKHPIDELMHLFECLHHIVYIIPSADELVAPDTLIKFNFFPIITVILFIFKVWIWS